MSEKKNLSKSQREKNIFLSPRRLWGMYLFSIMLSVLLCFAWLINIPSDLSAHGLFGFSPLRWVLITIFILLIVFSAALFYYFIIHKNGLSYQSSEWAKKSILLLPYLALCSVIFGIMFFLVKPLIQSTTSQAILTRLSPITVLLLAFGIFSEIFLFFQQRFTPVQNQNDWLPEKKSLIIIALAMAGAFLIIIITNLGLVSVPGFWGGAFPVPLFTSQFLIILFVLVFMLLVASLKELLKWKSSFWKNERLISFVIDVFICIVIWGTFFYFWGKVPTANTYFSPLPKLPNNEVYPYSDSRLYDMNAQSLLLGEMRLNGAVPVRPLYIGFLALLHVFAGQDYSAVTMLQTACLALLPVALYLLGKLLQDRLTGSILAIFVGWRELNVLNFSSATTTTNSKLILSELPTALLLAGFTLFIIFLISKKRTTNLSLILAGLVLALVVTLRFQAIILVVPVILMLYFSQSPRNIKAVILFSAGVVLGVLPWLLRNYLVTGRLLFEDPTYTDLNLSIATGSASSSGSGISAIIQYFIQNPLTASATIIGHFARNEVLCFFTLPVQLQQYTNVPDLFRPSAPAFLDATMVVPSWGQTILILLFLIILAFGIYRAFLKYHIWGLAPLFFLLFYNFGTAMFRYSGWRFISPVYWIVFLYFCIGLVFGVRLLLKYLSIPFHLDLSNADYSQPYKQKLQITAISTNKFNIGIGLVILIASLLPLWIQFEPIQYPKTSNENLVSEFMNLSQQIAPPQGQNLIRANILKDDVVLKGVAFYPRFYAAGDGEPTRGDKNYMDKDYPRLMMVLIGSNRSDVEIPIKKSPLYFPNASEVIVIGHQLDNLVRADYVLITKPRLVLIQSSNTNEYPN